MSCAQYLPYVVNNEGIPSKRLYNKIAIICYCAYSRIYWASYAAGKVLSAFLNGTGIETIVKGLTNTRAVTIDTNGR